MARKMLSLKKSQNASQYTSRYIIGIDEVGRGPLAGPVTVCAFCVDTQNISVKKLITELNFALAKDIKGNSKKYKKRIVFDSKSINEGVRERVAHAIYLYTKKPNMKSVTENKGSTGDKIYVSIKNKTARQIDTKGIATCIKDLVKEVLIDICTQIQSTSCDMGQFKHVHSSNNDDGRGGDNCAKSTMNYEHMKSVPVDNYEQIDILLDGGLRAPSQYMFQKTIIKGDAKEPLIGLASILAKVHRDTYMKKISKKYPKYGFEIHKGYGTKYHRDTIKQIGASELHRKSFLRNFNNF
ncbi:MAG: ribonuclease ribonuclease [Candidatus Parcubacteria bacterium]|jgi:ribonuclease HII